MVEALYTTHSRVNMTLSMFFIFYAGGLLFWGPLSEKFGRKPILFTGLAGYVGASILCVFAMNVEQLIGLRIVQAFGGSGVTVVATAVVKDLYDGRERERIMATVMSLVIISPMIAPVLGAFLLKITSWRILFVVLALFGTTAAAATLLFEETLEEKYTGSILHSWGRLAVVLKNTQFSSLLVIFSMVPMAMMAYLAASSYVYVSIFGLTEQQFSFFFAFNGFFAMIAPQFYIRVSKNMASYTLILSCFTLLTCCGLMVFFFGGNSPFIFALALAPATLSIITMRVPGVNLMLDQQEHDTGSASALINFSSMLVGSFGMLLVSVRPDHLIQSLGAIQITVGLLGGTLWFLMRNRDVVRHMRGKNNA